MEIRKDYIGNMTYSNVVHGLKHSKSGNEGANHSFCGLIFSQPDATSIGVDLDDNGRALLAGAVTCKTCRDALGLMEVDTTETRKDYVGNTTGKVIHGIKGSYNHTGPWRAHRSYCGLIVRHWIAKSKMDEMVEQITCKSCRDALGLVEVDTMEIRDDYVGNTAGKVVHGVKEAYNHNRPYKSSYKSYCGLTAARPWAPKSELDGMVGQITCKACRRILGLSNKHNEKPDYYLILDTSKGILEDVPPVVAATENKDYLKVILSKEAERVGHEHVNDFYRVVGIKEVEGTIISIKPKGYEITLTEQ